MLRRPVCALCLIFFLAYQLPAQSPPAAITGINVVDVVRGEIHAGQTVVIANGLIEAVGPSDSVNIPTAAVRIPGDGRYVMPGLWDMHVHLRSDQKNPTIRLVDENAALLDLCLPNGIVGIREMGGDLGDEIMHWRDEIRAGKRTGPRILTAGRKIDQEPPTWAGSLGVKTPAEAREAVRQVKQSGADFVKVYFTRVTPEVLHAVVDEAHKLNLKLTGHKPINMSIQEFIESGMDGMEHATYRPAMNRDEYDKFARERDRRMNTPWAMDGVEATARMLAMEDNKEGEVVYRRMAEKQFWVTPTLAVGPHILETGVRDYELDVRKRFIFPAIWASWDPKVGFRSAPQGRALEFQRIGGKRTQEATLAAYKAGVPMILGTDSGANNNYLMPGWSIHEELEEFVKAGLSPAEALRMATINAARWRGESDTQGTVERGKVADLLILRSNPLEAIRHTQEIDAVFKGGKRYSRSDLDEMLHQVEEKAAARRGASPRPAKE